METEEHVKYIVKAKLVFICDTEGEAIAVGEVVRESAHAIARLGHEGIVRCELEEHQTAPSPEAN